MRTFLKISFLLFSFIFITNCSNGDDSSNDANNDDVIIEPLNEFGLLEFKMFSNSNTSTDKIFEGSDDKFNYIGYGESFFSSVAGKNVPKNIKNVVQFDPDSDVSYSMELDNNYIPIEYRSNRINALDTIWSIQYDPMITEITVEVENIDGSLNFVETLTLPGFDPSSNDRNGTFNEDCLDEILDDRPLYICNDRELYEQFGEDFESTSGQTGHRDVSRVGKFINWVMEMARRVFCDDDTIVTEDRVFQAPFTCEDIEEPIKSYIKFLDTGEVFKFQDQVFVTNNIDCYEGTLYYINTEFNCEEVNNGGIIWPNDGREFMTIYWIMDSLNSVSWNWTSGSPSVYGLEQGDFIFSQQSNAGLTIIGHQPVYYSPDGNYNSDGNINRPIELVFRF
ncbi:hypothetical protein [Winogradskyella vincentii]|uniref:Uncharacterized protein n=1 Tax=Winogradskyella vincentii TaxID=2877122 RepID=A0ABS7Y2F8_9FLAO|nr:hypothetical protein [Winogradskyella vincentii]MCA0154106.1 hypothetical protein [Winogradskyella vincentii]